MENTKAIKGYKGFERDMTCRGFQFEEGREYEHEGEVKACSSGFHFCGHPLDVFNYYSPGESVFHEVEGSGDVSTHDEDSKVAVSKIKIGAEIKLPDFIGAAVKFMFEREYIKEDSNHSTGDSSAASATGDRSAASATGYRSAASATGYRSAASATGYRSAASATGYRSAASATGDSSAASATGERSAASATGYRSAASATGDRSAASATGYRSAVSATGYRSAASATGYRSAASATGYRSAASATGDSSAASATGDSSAAVCTGLESRAMAGKYGCIALAWWNVAEERGEMRCAETGCGDGSDGKLKAETWYKLNDNGEFVEA